MGFRGPQDPSLVGAKTIAFYREHGKAPERLGGTIDRVGFDTFRKAVL